jgi:hypothetical protein
MMIVAMYGVNVILKFRGVVTNFLPDYITMQCITYSVNEM